MIDDLTIYIDKAIEASRKAYVPYSNFPVGAYLIAKDGQMFTGCNVENAAYPACICAERTALVKAVSEGVKDFELIIVATKTGGTPCGVCRQMLYEFSPNMRVICVNFDGDITLDTSLDELLAYGFRPNDLGT